MPVSLSDWLVTELGELLLVWDWEDEKAGADVVDSGGVVALS